VAAAAIGAAAAPMLAERHMKNENRDWIAVRVPKILAGPFPEILAG
jgi:hypothetical protein